MFLHSPVLDTIVFVMCLLLFRELVVGDETANEDARLLMKHSKLWVRFGLWIILFLGVSYITLSDFWVLDCTCQQKLDTKLKKLGIKIEYLYKIQ